MQDFIRRRNVELLKRRLAEERDPERRRTLRRLLAEFGVVRSWAPPQRPPRRPGPQ